MPMTRIHPQSTKTLIHALMKTERIKTSKFEIQSKLSKFIHKYLAQYNLHVNSDQIHQRFQKNLIYNYNQLDKQ